MGQFNHSNVITDKLRSLLLSYRQLVNLDCFWQDFLPLLMYIVIHSKQLFSVLAWHHASLINSRYVTGKVYTVRGPKFCIIDVIWNFSLIPRFLLPNTIKGLRITKIYRIII